MPLSFPAPPLLSVLSTQRTMSDAYPITTRDRVAIDRVSSRAMLVGTCWHSLLNSRSGTDQVHPDGTREGFSKCQELRVRGATDAGRARRDPNGNGSSSSYIVPAPCAVQCCSPGSMLRARTSQGCARSGVRHVKSDDGQLGRRHRNHRGECSSDRPR